jgi:hypothetical protein
MVSISSDLSQRSWPGLVDVRHEAAVLSLQDLRP